MFKRSILIIFLLISALFVYSKEIKRNNILPDAKNYKDSVWLVHQNNIEDIIEYYVEKVGDEYVIKYKMGTDGIDDRMGKMKDINGDHKIDINDITYSQRNKGAGHLLFTF